MNKSFKFLQAWKLPEVQCVCKLGRPLFDVQIESSAASAQWSWTWVGLSCGTDAGTGGWRMPLLCLTSSKPPCDWCILTDGYLSLCVISQECVCSNAGDPGACVSPGNCDLQCWMLLTWRFAGLLSWTSISESVSWINDENCFPQLQPPLKHGAVNSCWHDEQPCITVWGWWLLLAAAVTAAGTHSANVTLGYYLDIMQCCTKTKYLFICSFLV